MESNIPPPSPSEKEQRLKVVELVLAFHRDARTSADTKRIMMDIQHIYDFIIKFTV